jgi:hypothetical protein
VTIALTTIAKLTTQKIAKGAGHDPVVCEAHKGFDLSHEDVEILGQPPCM